MGLWGTYKDICTYLATKIQSGGDWSKEGCSNFGFALPCLFSFGLCCFGITVILPASQIVTTLVLLRFCASLSLWVLKEKTLPHELDFQFNPHIFVWILLAHWAIENTTCLKNHQTV